MGGHRHYPKGQNKNSKGPWHDVLNFGQEKEKPERNDKQDADVSQRLKKLVKQLEDLNRRVDRLNHTDRY